MKGKILGKFYDLDDVLIYDIFVDGDKYELIVLEDNTYFYEIKMTYYGVIMIKN